MSFGDSNSDAISLITACLSNDADAVNILLGGMDENQMGYTLVLLASYLAMQISESAHAVGLDPCDYWQQTVMLVTQITE